MRAIAAAVAAGVALGLASRMIDTAVWAPDWIGYVFTPWLAAPWLAGALSASPRAGALSGLIVLSTTVVAYLAVVGARPVPVATLYGLALVAGPIFGAAGSTWRGGGPTARWGGALLGAAFVVEGLALQLVVHSAPERLLLTGESLAGIGLAAWLAIRRQVRSR